MDNRRHSQEKSLCLRSQSSIVNCKMHTFFYRTSSLTSWVLSVHHVVPCHAVWSSPMGSGNLDDAPPGDRILGSLTGSQLNDIVHC